MEFYSRTTLLLLILIVNSPIFSSRSNPGTSYRGIRTPFKGEQKMKDNAKERALRSALEQDLFQLSKREIKKVVKDRKKGMSLTQKEVLTSSDGSFGLPGECPVRMRRLRKCSMREFSDLGVSSLRSQGMPKSENLWETIMFKSRGNVKRKVENSEDGQKGPRHFLNTHEGSRDEKEKTSN